MLLHELHLYSFSSIPRTRLATYPCLSPAILSEAVLFESFNVPHWALPSGILIDLHFFCPSLTLTFTNASSFSFFFVSEKRARSFGHIATLDFNCVLEHGIGISNTLMVISDVYKGSLLHMAWKHAWRINTRPNLPTNTTSLYFTTP